jgi:hypothetical protein
MPGSSIFGSAGKLIFLMLVETSLTVKVSPVNMLENFPVTNPPIDSKSSGVMPLGVLWMMEPDGGLIAVGEMGTPLEVLAFGLELPVLVLLLGVPFGGVDGVRENGTI